MASMRCAMVFALSGMLVPGAAYALDLRMPGEQKLEQSDGERALGVCQAVDDVISLTAPSENKQPDGAEMFRVLWWKHMWGYTVDGPYFWSGKRFGVNLAMMTALATATETRLRCAARTTAT